MKRRHVHVAVESLAASVRFYSEFFAAEPTVLKDDYAKWMLEDPRVNCAISRRDAASGIEHLGIQVGSRAELEAVHARRERAERPVLRQGATSCCHAESKKRWIRDPQGLLWETFLTTGKSAFYGAPIDPAAGAVRSACCGPARGTPENA